MRSGPVTGLALAFCVVVAFALRAALLLCANAAPEVKERAVKRRIRNLIAFFIVKAKVKLISVFEFY